MERKIGEIFEFGGEWHQCIEDENEDCGQCDLSNPCPYNRDFADVIGNCTKNNRSDGTSIIFKKLEKVEEPYMLYGHWVQKYRFFHSPAIQVEGICISKTINTNNIIEIEIKQNKEDMEENKLSLKPFDIQKAREGKPVCTRDGRKARIICFDKKNDYYPIIALVETEGRECIFQYTSNGEYLEGNENNSHSNLMMLPERREGWVNVYNDAPIYDTKESAELGASTVKKRIGTFKISWEE